MEALEKSTNKWIEIETNYLFDNQYNTVDGRRIFDRDIKAIRNDARVGMGRCEYCGAMVKRGEEEKHFAEQEAKSCVGCWYYRDRLLDRKVDQKKTDSTNEKGEKIVTTTKTIVETYKPRCTYNDAAQANRTDCTYKECRRAGIFWFTSDNTFFLKYPNGFDDITDFDRLVIRGFVFEQGCLNGRYIGKLGSYRLDANCKYVDGKKIGVENFYIRNCRKSYYFRVVDGEFYVKEPSGYGYEKTNCLPGVPSDINKAVRAICNL